MSWSLEDDAVRSRSIGFSTKYPATPDLQHSVCSRLSPFRTRNLFPIDPSPHPPRRSQLPISPSPVPSLARLSSPFMFHVISAAPPLPNFQIFSGFHSKPAGESRMDQVSYSSVTSRILSFDRKTYRFRCLVNGGISESGDAESSILG